MPRNMQMFSMQVLDGSAKELQVPGRNTTAQFDSRGHVYVVRLAGTMKL